MKAVLKNGVIHPQEPIPGDWADGVELEVARASGPTTQPPDDQLDRWYEELNTACSQMDAEDDRILKNAIIEARKEEKELARKQAAQE